MRPILELVNFPQTSYDRAVFILHYGYLGLGLYGFGSGSIWAIESIDYGYEGLRVVAVSVGSRGPGRRRAPVSIQSLY